MKAIQYLSLFAVTFLFFQNCQSQNSAVTKLNPDSFEQKMSTTANKILLDVRTNEEYAEGHLAASTQIDFYREDFKEQLALLDKTKPVFVYCRAGKRSGSTAEMLTGLGFTQVYDLEGGIEAWTAANKPVVKE